uniref:COMM domain-containing protein n=1 Tax=Angiostrongylus cantonensis TaxID=6313 RepID=A0A0K0DC98_ANGCA
MLLPSLPTFPQGFSHIEEESFEKIARKVLVLLPSTSLSEHLFQSDENELLARDFGLSLEDLEKVVVFLRKMWIYLIYYRFTGESLLNVLKSCLPSPYIGIVSSIWYSEGPSIFTYFARQTASDKSRVKDISWSIWTQIASSQPTERDGELGIQLDVSTERGTLSLYLSSQEVAALHRETIRIQSEIDKLLEGS